MLGLAASGLIAGCSRPQQQPPVKPAAHNQTPVAARNAPPAAVEPPLEEQWMAVFLGGGQVGHVHSVTWLVNEEGKQLRRKETTTQLTLTRENDVVTHQGIEMNLQTPDGRLVRFRHQTRDGTAPTVVEGRVEDAELIVARTIGDAFDTRRIKWSADAGGFDAVEDSLTKQPIKPGETRTLRAINTILYEVLGETIMAQEYETVQLLDGPRKLLRVQRTTVLPKRRGTMTSTAWVDEAGRLMKVRDDSTRIEGFLTTKQRALAPPSTVQLDVLANTRIKLEKPLANAHHTKRVRYRIRAADVDPATLFAAGATQSIRQIDPRTIELEVRAVGPDTKLDAAATAAVAQDGPSADDRDPNGTLQSADANVAGLAAQAAGSRTDPWQLAVALERHVHQSMRNVNYTQGFATAAEVAKRLEGDCTEHAVLLAAMARARKIPARVAVGLVYIEPQTAFGFHMWTEVWIRDRWIPLDATLGAGGIAAAHLQAAHTNLKSGLSDPAILAVAKLIGAKLRIEVLSAE